MSQLFPSQPQAPTIPYTVRGSIAPRVGCRFPNSSSRAQELEISMRRFSATITRGDGDRDKQGRGKSRRFELFQGHVSSCRIQLPENANPCNAGRSSVVPVAPVVSF